MSEGQPCREASEDPLRQTSGSMSVCRGGGAESGVMGQSRVVASRGRRRWSCGQTNRRPPKLHKGILSAVGSWRVHFVLGPATVWEQGRGTGGLAREEAVNTNTFQQVPVHTFSSEWLGHSAQGILVPQNHLVLLPGQPWEAKRTRTLHFP